MTDILIVDDDSELRTLLREFLVAEQFAVEDCADGQTALRRITEVPPALVLLDVMMPGLDGFETLRRIRQVSEVPVLMLTARGEDIDRIIGLELGADDYLPKPFNHRELLARMRAILRRENRSGNTPQPLEAGGVRLLPASMEVFCSGEEVQVTQAEFELLRELLEHAGQVVTRDSLSRVALGRRLQAQDRALDMHISNLRRKLGSAADGSERIRTVRGRGYLLRIEP